MHKIHRHKLNAKDSAFPLIIQMSYSDLIFDILYSELRLIFVYLESDSWCLTAWVSPGLFLGQAGCIWLREGGESANPSQPAERRRESVG